MSDEIDDANDRMLLDTALAIANAAKPLAPGVPGECDLCGEWTGRLIRGACAPCRDKWRLP